MMSDNGRDGQHSERQIRNLQGLLNFCTDITAREDTTQDTSATELTPERREFLENVLRSMQEDVPKILIECLSKLTVSAVEDVDADVSVQEDALDQLSEYAEDINYAIDLDKLNGFPILVRVLKCPHPSLQKLAAQVIGDICQNNEACQKNMLPLGTMEILLDILNSHPDTDCRVKALYALSCLTRDFEPAEKQFEELSGFCHLMRAIQTRIPKLVTKGIFLLNFFIQKSNDHKDTLLSMGFIEQLVCVLFSDDLDDISREYCTLSLLNFTSSYEKAVEECLRPEFKLMSQLRQRRSFIAGKDEHQDEEGYINSLLKVLEKEDSIEDSMLR